MIDVSLLGTGGMMPLPYRFLTSLMLRYNGSSIMVDCGEATQIAIRKKGWSFKPIDIICFTHFHADHISGLPGLLLTMGNSQKTSDLILIGPKGLERVVKGLLVIAGDLPFEIKYIELDQDEQDIEMDGFTIRAFKAKHRVTCYGYSFYFPRLGKFDVDKAKANDVPVKYWNALQHGETVTADGVTYVPEMVIGPARKGIKLTYCTDSRPISRISDNAKDSDLFICEGMYGEPDKLAKAKEYTHMTFYEAAKLGKAARVKEMWLTHYSPSLTYPQEYQDEARKIFPELHTVKDGWTKELVFEDE